MNSIKFDKFDKSQNKPHSSEHASFAKEQAKRLGSNNNRKGIESSMIQKPTKEELRYLAENNRIMMTLGKYGEEAPVFIQENVLKEKSAEPLVNSVKQELQRPTVFVEPAIKKTKSILKLPSNFTERTICFEDRIDVIPIDSNDNSTMPNSRLSPASPGYLQAPSNGEIHFNF